MKKKWEENESLSRNAKPAWVWERKIACETRASRKNKKEQEVERASVGLRNKNCLRDPSQKKK